MIGKVPRPGRGFRGLVSYLLHGTRRGPQTGRVAWTASRNLLIDDPERAPLLMRITARKSVRVVKPVYHFVISWHRDERPTPELMRQVADATCRDLDLEEYQRLYIAHHDTMNPHVHIVVNRVHPETGVAWQTSHDYRRIEQSLARQARELGLEVVPGRHNRRISDDATPRRLRDGAFQRERREKKSMPERVTPQMLDRWRSVLVPAISSAPDWSALVATLAAHGLRFVRKGQGAVITDGRQEMKLSDIGPDIRWAGLEGRLGAWPDSTSAGVSVRPASLQRLRRRRDRDR